MPNRSEHVLRDFLDVLRRRWATCVLVAAVVITVTVPVALGLPNLYRASASLMVDQAPDPLGQRDNQMLELSARLQTLRQEALSRQRALDLAEELDLYPEQRAAGQLDAVVALMQRDLKVEPTSASRGDGRTTTVSFRISYTGSDQRKVAAVANHLAKFYVDRNDDILSRRATLVVEQLKKELDATQKLRDVQEEKVIKFTTENAGTLPAQVASMQAKYQQLMQQLQTNTGQITGLMDRRDTAQNSIAALSASAGTVNVSDPAVRLEVAQRELKDLLAKYWEENPAVRNKRSEIAGLQEQVAAVSRSSGPGTGEASQLGTLRSQIASLTLRIDSLKKDNEAIQTELDRQEALMKQAPIRNAEFEKISREASQTRLQYDSLFTRYQNALVGERAQQGSGGAEFQILDPAVPAESPSAPNRQLLIALGLMSAVGLGLGVALLVDRMDRSFKSVDELRAFTHVPVLATIPRIVLRRSRVKRVLTVSLAGAVVSTALWFVSVGVFHVAQNAELLTRLLLR